MTTAASRRISLSGIAVTFLVACAGPAVVDDHLRANGMPTTEFSIDDSAVTLSARFATYLPAEERFMVEWLFPDGRVYLRKPVQRGRAGDDVLETSMSIRGRTPARHPGIWQVHLWHHDEKLVGRSFEIREPVSTAASDARDFATLAFCGPSRWNDPVISGRRSGALTPGRPGAWIGGEVLESAGATYSGVILLTGCAPG